MSKQQRARSRFKVITPLRSLVLCSENREEDMEEWLTPRTATENHPQGDSGTAEILGGNHQFYATNHARPTYCNVCRDALPGVTSHGLSCETCKYKVHKRCAAKAINNCKWTTLASIGKDIIEDQDGNITMPHQWMEGNLPVSSKCFVCEKTCGSVLRLQDWRCVWCKATVHTACRPAMSIKCPLGPCKLSIVPPTALHNIGSDEAWEAVRPTGCSPLLVFVNSKSGDNQGIKFLRRFKQLLNPAQVFDLIKGGPGPGLRLFRHFDPFRILVCSGDGSVGWVLSEIDRLGMHARQCQIGVLPLGTGNDLARVLGWGSSCDDDAHLPQLMEKYEKAGTKMLDRWSIMTFERNISLSCHKVTQPDPTEKSSIAHQYEDSVLAHLTNILQSDQESVVLSSAKVLCTTVKDFETYILEASLNTGDQQLGEKCTILQQKLDLLLQTLSKEESYFSDNTEDIDVGTLKTDTFSSIQEKGVLEKPEKEMTNLKKIKRTCYMEKDIVMSRVNSLKKAVRKLVEHAEIPIGEQNNLSDEKQSNQAICLPIIESNSIEISCPSPTPNVASLSPMPDLRRDSQPEELLTLPAPDSFADSRRNSENIPQGSYTVRNSTLSEVDHKDSDIFDSTRKWENAEIGHYDSPDNSDMLSSEIQHSESGLEDLSSLRQDVIMGDVIMGYDSVSEGLEFEESHRYCGLAQFSEGNDIGRYSFKKGRKNIKTDKEGMLSKYKTEGLTTCVRVSGIKSPQSVETNVVLETTFETIEKEKTSDLLRPVCCFPVPDNTNEKCSTNFPPQISVIVDPPSPSLSIESHHKFNLDYKLDPHDKQYSGNSMERLSVELPNSGFSPQATRRISSGSLLKASEVVSLMATTARLGGSSMSLRHERAKSVDKTEDVKKLPIINPLVRLPMWPNVSGGAGLISQVLLANADALCAPVSPLMDPDETLMEGYFERCVMNNYFGIGIDAKISLDFHNKREEHPEKCRSRAKNYMWYGVLGSKEWIQKTYKNLEQRVQLECDGQRIPLPSLQGIVVLNIPSFMGGTNFWGGTKEGDLFLAPSFDDRILEVVAVFGSVQMAASRLINLQHHRIAQCQTVQINILGEEGVPIQVDGEAWIQPPGVIKIIHKNRMQMLYRNRALETSLKTWEEKQRSTLSAQSSSINNTSQSRPQLQLCNKPPQLNDEELNILLSFIETVTTLVKWVKLLIISHPTLERDLYQVASRTAYALEQVHPNGKILQGVSLRPMVTELVSSARQLYEESCELLRDKAHNLKLREDLENKLSVSLAQMEQQLRKCTFDEGGTGLVYLQNIPADDQGDKKNRHRGLFWLKCRRIAGSAGPARDLVTTWGVPEVCAWLENLRLAEYTEKFIAHDIRGRELLTLARRDLKELGITKVGHVKRILQAINDLNN
ncbi:PREDICTED: diacylglycerol kinase eta isoform X8 [Acromyrmex echinatior]|uniref:diacylglycerol kinase eta isoform X8 n=1 Tax=Acromyrmex echinatior TaxID=103372 RepID=UPI000580CD30|nr:PREDICTED: diacylglycerol kinase eta isoform X8 [Acromyrmex echinatior]